MKWTAVVIGFFFILLAVSFLGWNRFTGNQLQAAIDKITESGEPLFPEDFNSPPIPDHDNAAVLYEKAAKLITDSRVHKSPLVDKCLELSVNDQEFTSTCGVLVASHKEALRLVREARQRPSVSWSSKFDTPLLDHILPDHSGMRAAAKLLSIKTELDHLNQDDKEVVENLKDLLALGAAIDQYPTTISHLVALAIEAQALNNIESIGSNLSLSSVHNSESAQVASRAVIENIINRLLNDNVLSAGIQRAFQNERAIQLDVVLTMSGTQATANGSSAPAPSKQNAGWTTIPLIPLFKLDGVAMLEHMNYLLKAIRSETHVEYRVHLDSVPTPPWERATTRWQQIKHIISLTMSPALNRAVEIHYRLLTHRRMGATALAIRLYEYDHGHRPRTLDALVPEFLPAIPADAMSSNGVIQYLPDAEFPRLYSVGSNGLDDQGSFAYKRTGKIDFDALDLQFFLDGSPPAEKNPGADGSQ